jgi:serine/threonine-protein phosphatase 2A regulatory subunit A
MDPVAGSEDQSLYTVQILIDELRNEDTQLRLHSVRNLDKISRALGPQRTRDDLLPLISGRC